MCMYTLYKNTVDIPVIMEATAGDVQMLLSRYVGQLTDGCGKLECTQIRCHTGRLNITQQPIRRLTSRSARIIALAICSGPMPMVHLCQYYDIEGSASSEESASARDPSSMMQQLVDTPIMRRLFGPIDVTLEPQDVEFRELQDMQRRLHTLLRSSAHQPGQDLVPNIGVADTLCHCLQWLLDKAPLTRLAPWYWVDAEVISKGNAYPQANSKNPADPSYNTWLAILDVLDRASYSRLLESVCKVVVRRCWLERKLVAANPKRSRSSSDNLCAMIASRLVPDRASKERAIALSIWLKKLFAQNWDAKPYMQHYSICSGILSILQALYNRLTDLSFDRVQTFVMRFLTAHVSVTDFSRAWAARVEYDDDGDHLIQFRFLFMTEELFLIFRTINHLSMSQAHLLSIQARSIRTKSTDVKDEQLNEQQRFAETNCLLLSVSRTDMLKDTFDQLWHRRREELRRPLRVRLGTTNELQVGQDLGGVQMEFFNLLCREALDEQAQMFTTEPRSGLSYLRPGSLQPLHYFRQFGVLLALAMYNGITLPITLPKVFYHFLIGLPPDSGNDIEMLEDGWPEVAKTLQSLSAEDIKDLDFTFDLNANGLHISALVSPEDFSKTSPEPWLAVATLKVVDHYPKKLDLEEMAWPGWNLRKAESDPEVVTPENKLQYIHMRRLWHTWGSVAPQLCAVIQGFRATELLPVRTLSSLFTARTLKAYTEGLDYLDINKLRATATYTDYDANEDYIQSFWRIVGSWPQIKQKQLLKFVTAAERIPFSGPGLLVFRIKQADNPEHLPTSHTCFGTLDLPRYESSEVMAKKLSLALLYGSEGFGIG